MSTDYILSSTTSDLTGPFEGGASGFQKKLLVATETAANLSVTVPGNDISSSYIFCEPGIPGTDGLSIGAFTVILRASAASGTNSLQVTLARVNSSNVVQAQTALSTAQSISTTPTDKTFSFTDPALGTWTTGDRFRVRIRMNTTGASPRAITIEAGGTHTKITVPWNTPPPSTFQPQAILL